MSPASSHIRLAPGTGPRPSKKWSGHGRPPKLLRRDDKHKPASVKELALALPKRAWRKITWREGTAEKLSSRFARVRVRVAHRDYWLADKRLEEWLLIEWPDGEKEPIKYWLSTLPEDIVFRRLVDIAKVRWRIERDYQELKPERSATSRRKIFHCRLSRRSYGSGRSFTVLRLCFVRSWPAAESCIF
jgi:SRSO17 transposase